MERALSSQIALKTELTSTNNIIENTVIVFEMQKSENSEHISDTQIQEDTKDVSTSKITISNTEHISIQINVKKDDTTNKFIENTEKIAISSIKENSEHISTNKVIKHITNNIEIAENTNSQTTIIL